MTSRPVEPPIFHFDGNDMSSYGSLEAAGADVESYDVDVGTWYDRNGRVLQATAPKGAGPERIVVVAPEETVYRPDVLANSVREHLKFVALRQPVIARQVGLTAESVETAQLEELVDMCGRVDVAWRARPPLPRRLWDQALRPRH